MNYFAHGQRFLDEPYFLAGTATPDWLSVCDRRVRLRSRQVRPVAEQSGGRHGQLAAGVLQHLQDDDWFHETPAFVDITADLARRFRQCLSEAEGVRPGFLGHIAAELLIDAALIRRDPARLETYYERLAAVEPMRVERSVNSLAVGTTTRLATWIGLFLRERFLWDYLDPAGLRHRLNQVLGRVRLCPLPTAAEAVLVDGSALITDRLTELLPEPHCPRWCL
jgi:hypothetical protein